MRLIEPTTEYSRQIQAYRKEFLDCGDSMDGTHGLREIEDPVKWIEHCALYKDPLTVPDSRVPATQYIFVREEDDNVLTIFGRSEGENVTIKYFQAATGNIYTFPDVVTTENQQPSSIIYQ